jgi:hypothetical protein
MNRGIGMFLMNIAVACYLLCAGILAFNNNWLESSEIRRAVTGVIRGGELSNIIVIVLAIFAIAAGVFILLRLFNISLPIPIDLILVVLCIVWLVLIVLIDIIPGLENFGKGNFISWLQPFSTHLMVLAGIALATERFGGR